MIDTLGLTTQGFTVKDDNALTVQPAPFSPATGEVRGEGLLFWQGARPISGAKAYMNTPEGIGVTIRPTAQGPRLLVHLSAGRILRGVNLDPVELPEAIEAAAQAGAILAGQGLELDLPAAQVARLDLCRNAELSHPFTEYQALLETLQGRRMNQRIYSGQGALWGNRQQELCIYDKGLESAHTCGRGLPQVNGAGCIARAEARFLKARKVRETVGADRLHDLTPEALRNAHRGAVQGIFRAGVPDVRLDSLGALLESCGPVRGVQLFLRAVGATNIDPGAVSQYLRGHPFTGTGRRMKRKRALDYLEQAVSEAGPLMDTRGWPALYAELRQAFLPAC